MKYITNQILCLALLLGIVYANPINKEYSYKDFKNVEFKEISASEFNNTDIVGSCFYQQSDMPIIVDGEPVTDWVEKDIFPDGMVGVVFKKCNLDNVLIPSGNTVDGSSTNKHMRRQNDMEDWFIDKKTKKPIEPINKAKFIELGLDIDPKKIPNNKIGESVVNTKEKEIIDALLTPIAID